LSSAPLKNPFTNPKLNNSPRVPVELSGIKNLYFKDPKAWRRVNNLSNPENTVSLKKLSQTTSSNFGLSWNFD
jgi:hypothetical protein